MFVTNTTIAHETSLINTNLLLTRFHSDMFQLSKGHLQGVWQKHFNSRVNKMN